MSTTLLPAARRDAGSTVRPDVVGPLNAVHDHVLRQLGDAAAAAAVVADVAARASARAQEGAPRPTRTQLLRQAHARMAVETRAIPGPQVVARLAGGDDIAATTLVEAMAVPGRAGAALLDLTARHDLDLKVAADVIGLDRKVAAATHTEALRQVRAHVAEVGVGLGVAVPAALAQLPVVPASAELHERFLPAARTTGRPVPAAVAWLGTAAVLVATVGALAGALPRLTDETRGEAPVVTAEQVTDTPASRQLATPGDDVPAEGVERLVVQLPPQESSRSEPATDEPAPEPEQDAEPSPEPEPSGSEEPAPEEPEEPKEPEESPEPGNPLDLDLLDP